MGFKEAEDADAGGRIAALEERADQHDSAIAALQDKLKQVSTDFGRLTGEVSTLRSVAAEMRTLSGEVSALKEQIAAGLRERVSEQLSAKFDDLRREVLAPKTQIAGLPPHPVPSVPIVPPPPSPAPVPPSPQPPVPSTPSLDSRIISDFPANFAEFRKFSLLWRGSRDGFQGKEFHRRCDGHANTLTVILDTDGNIFGGFTPVEWESRVWNRKGGDRNNCRKADDSQKSFLFTLKNPHNIPARRFGLKAERKHEAIYCSSGMGPCFRDITVSDNCNASTCRSTCPGYTYTNDTGLHANRVLTGSREFQVKEIEVFQIRD
jgi:hypothetical protein